MDRADQAEHQAALRERYDIEIGEDTYVSPLAMLDPDRLRIGRHSYVAAYSYVTHDVEAGDDCTINPFAVVRGRVRLGNGVRIGAHASILGFNHSIEPSAPVFMQPTTTKGIVVGDDVWIGSNCVILDGVSVGDHSVIAAGAVVTKDVPAWTIVGGNPARVIRDRRSPSRRGAAEATFAERLQRFADRAREEATAVLDRAWNPTLPEGGAFTDTPHAGPTVRAQCDAIEIADLLLLAPPPQLSRDEQIRRLGSAQDPVSGLVPTVDASGVPDPAPPEFGSNDSTYHILAAGYALDLLGSSFLFPISSVARMTAAETIRHLDALPWADGAWSAGAWIDAWATAVHWNVALGEPGEPGALEALFGWLLTRADPWTGTWGSPSIEEGRLQQINGYYRLTRGSFAQFGLPLPHPERLVDTVLDHARDPRYFAPGRQNACNVLDVAHPLWLAGRQTGYRSADARSWAREQLDHALKQWQPNAGFGFAVSPSNSPAAVAQRAAGLQGTEMWLAIVWFLADLIGESEALGYRPRGVHRPEPARTLHGIPTIPD